MMSRLRVLSSECVRRTDCCFNLEETAGGLIAFFTGLGAFKEKEKSMMSAQTLILRTAPTN